VIGRHIYVVADPRSIAARERAFAAAIATHGFNVHLGGESRRVVARLEAF
jgi:hypothetical protein